MNKIAKQRDKKNIRISLLIILRDFKQLMVHSGYHRRA